MKDQKNYWDQKIVGWEKSAYVGTDSPSLLENLATPFRGILKKRLKVAEDLVGNRIKNKIVIDLGCGTGIFLKNLVKYRPKKLIGVDIAPAAIKMAGAEFRGEKAGGGTEFICADVRQDLSFLKSAEIVTGIGFIDYFRPEELLRLFRSLEGKQFLFSFPVKAWSWREILHAFYLKLASCPGSYEYSRKEMDEILTKAGIKSWWYYDQEKIRFVTNLPRSGFSRDEKDLPTVSVLIPTLNSGRVLESCLESIAIQDYPKDRLEVIIADGGSTDGTLAIAKKHRVRVYENPLKTGEAGKAVALRQAEGDLVALVDSDNVLPGRDWLKKMVAPFQDPEIIGSEPWSFTYRKEDGFVDRYCALIGMGDPLRHFIGDYDRLNTLTDRWTSLPIKQKDEGGWIKFGLQPPRFPTIGANGTILRRQALAKSKLVENYLADVDVLVELAKKKPINFAKVKTGIIHLYCGSSVRTFIRKQKRRVRDYLYYRNQGIRQYPWEEQNKAGILAFIVSCLILAPLIYQAIRGFLKKPDWAWFFHPVACWLTLWLYGTGTISSLWRVQELSRENWRQ